MFQSERDAANPFYQIYMLDFATGDTKRISPGMGKTTCAFFRPGSDEILFASTHHDPKSKQYQDEELAFRASGKERRYAWDYDPGDGHLRLQREDRRADAPDQRARATTPRPATRPTGSGSSFSSMRDAYNRTLSPDGDRSSSRRTRATSPRSTS